MKNVSWDEPLPCELLERWEKLLDGLKQVHSITIPRCYFSNWTSCSLRGFCDASQHAYAAVVYLRIETDGSCYSKLVVAKTRVCPLQKHSKHRLELLGALLLSRLLSWAHSALRVELRLEPSICYTDSIVVLQKFDDLLQLHGGSIAQGQIIQPTCHQGAWIHYN